MCGQKGPAREGSAFRQHSVSVCVGVSVPHLDVIITSGRVVVLIDRISILGRQRFRQPRCRQRRGQSRSRRPRRGPRALRAPDWHVVEQLEALHAFERLVVRVLRVLQPLADGRVDGRVDDGLVEVDDQGELLRLQESRRRRRFKPVGLLLLWFFRRGRVADRIRQRAGALGGRIRRGLQSVRDPPRERLSTLLRHGPY